MAFTIDQFLSPNLTNMLVTLVVPFLIIFGVLLFALKRTGVFGSGSSIYVIISLGITFMIYAVNPGNVFQFLSAYLFQIGVIWAILALILVLVLVSITFFRGAKNISGAFKSDAQKFKDLEKEEEKLLKKYTSQGILGVGGTNTGQRLQIQQKLEDLQRQKKYLLAKMKKL